LLAQDCPEAMNHWAVELRPKDGPDQKVAAQSLVSDSLDRNVAAP
jgi:hypothetical protein